ncbi:MAG: aminotransferase class V-fold PLP-dependent enzyme, partial [Anaerolineae bacterium]
MTMPGGAPAAAKDRPPPRPDRPFDPDAIRRDFPALALSARGKPLVYLDNAATTHKPRAVIDAVTRHYEEHNANVHRGVHYLAEAATDAYEGARGKVARFIGAQATEEIVFTRGCTEAINLVASCLARSLLGPGDEVLVT